MCEINYNDEYKKYLRCRACNRATNGEKDYINKINNKLTKNCIKCRTSATKSQKKNPYKKQTKKEKIIIYENIICHLKNNKKYDYELEKMIDSLL